MKTYEVSPSSHRLHTNQEDSDRLDQRMPGRWGSVPGIGRNSRDPKVRVASSLIPLPSDNAVNIVSMHQTVNALHGGARGKCSKARKWNQ
jgi:hypothetical protein